MIAPVYIPTPNSITTVFHFSKLTMPSQRLQRLQTLLLLTSTRSDAFLTHLTRLLSTHSGIDATLCTLQYLLTFVHSQLVRLLTNKYEKLAISIASKASETMLPGEALVATIEAPHVTLTEWCAGVKSFGDTADDVRTFMRYVFTSGVLHDMG